WSLKRLHKLILTSEAYRQSTRVSPEAAAKDPDNALLSQMNRQRLEGEAVRDALLAVSGRLNPKAGGPGVVLPEAAQPAGGSKALADHLAKESASETERIERAYRLTLGRPPTATERERAAAFLRDSPLTELCRALFNLNEFVYLD